MFELDGNLFFFPSSIFCPSRDMCWMKCTWKRYYSWLKSNKKMADATSQIQWNFIRSKEKHHFAHKEMNFYFSIDDEESTVLSPTPNQSTSVLAYRKHFMLNFPTCSKRSKPASSFERVLMIGHYRKETVRNRPNTGMNATVSRKFMYCWLLACWLVGRLVGLFVPRW